jgi:hypothetical protein
MFHIPSEGEGLEMMKKVGLILIGTLFVAACGQTPYTSSPSPTALVEPPSSGSGRTDKSTRLAASLPAQGQPRVGFGFNGTVSGFPTGEVFLTGGGAYNRTANFVDAAGGFKCLQDVLQGPLSTSINPDDSGPCRAGEGVRWDTAALLPSTTFKCTGAASEALKTAVTNDKTVVLQADFYRASNGNDESFTAKMIVSDGDIASDFPGVNLWVERVGCGTARAMNFSK